MSPGKLFKLQQSAFLWPYDRKNVNENGKLFEVGKIFLVLSCQPDKNISNYYDLRMPWLILIDGNMGLIDISNLWLFDVTPRK